MTVIVSSPTRESLIKAINKYFLSTSWELTDDNKLYNKKLKKFDYNYKITHKNKRWQLNVDFK